jgi:hypothetical protein
MFDGAGARCSGFTNTSRTRARCCWFRISIQSRQSERAVRTNRSASTHEPLIHPDLGEWTAISISAPFTLYCGRAKTFKRSAEVARAGARM